MAIIGNFESIRKNHFRDSLDVVFDYLAEALDASSDIHQRIFSRPLGSFEKVTLNKGVFALEQVYNTKERIDCFFESHRKYVDFQLHLDGIELMEHIHIDKVLAKSQYSIEKDLIIYYDSIKSNNLVMEIGDMAIFYPEDVHMGVQRMNDQESLVYKTVVKVPVDLL